MKKSNLYLSAAVLSTVALTGCDGGQKDTAAKSDMEKCYGVAKAGKNDCAASDKSSSCQGTSKVDGDPKAWMYMPKGLCEKIVGGSLTPKA